MASLTLTEGQTGPGAETDIPASARCRGPITINEPDEFIDLVAQAVIDKIEERDKLKGLADLVIARVIALQKEDQETSS